ncbi:MAG: T9SS type A sorting domain-containing protein [candidate division KSB1 bacterium]|nr:T9SS type A sorting domain-containing protein [candidate division KSB1 bacterium]
MAVNLTSFTAEWKNQSVSLQWDVENLINHAGFNVYRSDNSDSGYEKINSNLIVAGAGQTGTATQYIFTDRNASSESMYKLQEVSINGEHTFYGPVACNMLASNVRDDKSHVFQYRLHENFPNPFNLSTTVQFECAQAGPVSLKIFNMRGQLVKTLLNQTMGAGEHSINWNGMNEFGLDQSSGVYFVTITAGEYTDRLKVSLVR